MRFYTLQRRLILLIFTFFYNNAVKCLRRVPDEQFLISRLLNDYDPASRPVFNASHTVEVKFGIAFIQICDMVKTYFSKQIYCFID